MNAHDSRDDYVATPHVYPSFFDDIDTEEAYDFIPISRNSKVPKNPTVLDQFLMINLNKNKSIVGLFGLFGHYIVFCTKENRKITQSLVIDADKARIQRKQMLKDGFFSFNLIKNGTVFQFISDMEEAIDTWIHRLKLLCLFTDYHQQYKTLKFIGYGSFSRVCLSEHKISHKKFAVKAFSKSFQISKMQCSAKDNLSNEINIMRALSHRNIVRLYEIYETEHSIYFVMEYINGKSLGEMLQGEISFDAEQIQKIMCGIFSGLSYMASKRVMHRDLNPYNVLIDENGNPKIVDFGLATFLDGKEHLFSKYGTPGYIAPEVLRPSGGGSKPNYGDKCDVFSAGCIFYYMVFGQRFFQSGTAPELMDEAMNYKCDNESFRRISEELTNPSRIISRRGLEMLLRLLQWDPKLRPNAAKCLQFSYLSDYMDILSGKKHFAESDIQRRNSIQTDVGKKDENLQNTEKTSSIYLPPLNPNAPPSKDDGSQQTSPHPMFSLSSPKLPFVAAPFSSNTSLSKDSGSHQQTRSQSIFSLSSSKLPFATPHLNGASKTIFKQGEPLKYSRFSEKNTEGYQRNYFPSRSKSIAQDSLLKYVLIKESIKNSQIAIPLNVRSIKSYGSGIGCEDRSEDQEIQRNLEAAGILGRFLISRRGSKHNRKAKTSNV